MLGFRLNLSWNFDRKLASKILPRGIFTFLRATRLKKFFTPALIFYHPHVLVFTIDETISPDKME